MFKLFIQLIFLFFLQRRVTTFDLFNETAENESTSKPKKKSKSLSSVSEVSSDPNLNNRVKCLKLIIITFWSVLKIQILKKRKEINNIDIKINE